VRSVRGCMRAVDNDGGLLRWGSRQVSGVNGVERVSAKERRSLPLHAPPALCACGGGGGGGGGGGVMRHVDLRRSVSVLLDMCACVRVRNRACAPTALTGVLSRRMGRW
jgi:hypothetical protein